VYVGHAAIALAIRARRPEVPLVPLVLASYGPDWAELILGLFEGRAEMREVTHTVPAVLACALTAAAAYSLFTNRAGAGAVMLAWLLHWPADFLTAHKPLLGTSDLVGLDLYDLPAADFAVESFLVVVCCVMYARAFARTPAHRRWVVAMATLLIGMQGGLDFGLARAGNAGWHPVLADRRWRSHPPHSVSGQRPTSASACVLHSCWYFHSERAMATDSPRAVVTLVCLTCGKEQFFTQEVPAAVACTQCGSTVFRTFTTPTEPDEAVIDAAEMQARSIAYGDSSPDSTADDVRDLDAR
jgi:DNA-directed RNA polymerase subunit RPC12/RpoP